MSITNAQHHAHPAIGSSGLRLLDRSPFHFWSAYIDPDRKPQEPTAAMKLGTATHMAILEPAEFDQNYVVIPDDIDRRTTAGKQLWADVQATGKEPIKQSDWDLIAGMMTSVHTHPLMRMIAAAEGVTFEQSVFWTDESGVLCKMRPDIFVPPQAAFPDGLIVDLKTTPDASRDAFGRKVWDMDMQFQAAFYQRGGFASTGRLPEFVWLAVEKSAPFACAAYRAPNQLTEYADAEIDRLLSIYAQCSGDDKWPSYDSAVTDVLLPGWAKKIIEGSGEVEVNYVD